ncbi:MAG: tetratricopeptide repeat protein [Thermaerobacter sp.]|nr:tetratricopeptide repeat protein [Thermaerobacter sp.]
MTERDDERTGWDKLETGHYEEAETAFRSVLEINPLHSSALTGLGVIYLAAGEVDQARDLLEMALSQAERELPRKKRHARADDPLVRPYVRALFYLAVASAEEGEWEQVVDPLEDLMAWDASGFNGDAILLLAQGYHRTGRLEEAARTYLESGDKHPEALYSLGLVYFQQGRVKDAERFWLRALRRHPELAFLIARYPRVRALPLSPIRHREFSANAEYIEATVDLWPMEARAALDKMCQQAALGSG